MPLFQNEFSRKTFHIHPIPKWPQFKYSFVHLQIIPCCLVSVGGKILLNFQLKSGATRVNLQENKRVLKWQPFWNKVYENEFDLCENERSRGTHFHVNGFAQKLLLTQMQKASRKWPIAVFTHGKYFDDGKRI